MTFCPRRCNMANANSTLSPDAARLVTYTGSYGNCYSGTASKLIEAGIAKAEWLPGQYGNAKTCTRVGLIDGEMRLLPFKAIAKNFQKKNGLIHIYKASKSTFTVDVRKPQEEID